MGTYLYHHIVIEVQFLYEDNALISMARISSYAMCVCVCVCVPNHIWWYAKWKLSWNIHTLHTRFCTFGTDLHAQSVLINKISASELSQKFIKSALLVGCVCVCVQCTQHAACTAPGGIKAIVCVGAGSSLY